MPLRWLATWTAAPQLAEPENMPPLPLADVTLRQTIHVSAGGPRLRLALSNAFGAAPLPIAAAALALPAGGHAGVPAVQPGTTRPVLFGGRRAVTIPEGAHAVSDPVDFALAPATNLTVTLYLPPGGAPASVTSHPGSRTTSHLLPGDHAEAIDLPAATPVDHWYLISALDAWSAGAAIATLGDSLTDGRGSTTNANDRWPDLLLARLRADPATAGLAVVNQAVGGNRVLAHGLGPSALSRLDRDVVAQAGVRWLIVFHGINDIGTAAPRSAVGDDLIAAYRQIITRAHTHAIRVYGATLPPFGGNDAYDDPAGHREATRQRVNAWIRGAGAFDAVLDFDGAARDPSDPRRLLPAHDEGDHLHMTPAGYHSLAATISPTLFHPVDL